MFCNYFERECDGAICPATDNKAEYCNQPEAPAPQQGGVSNSSVLLAALRSYRCQNIVDERGDGIELVDVLTPRGDGDITRGLEELQLLAEHLDRELGG